MRNSTIIGNNTYSDKHRGFTMTEVQKKKCTLIIHGAAASGAAMAAVMAQAPGSDNIPLVAL